MATTKTELPANTALRRPAEEIFAHELEALGRDDERARPANWRLSPHAVVTYVMGGKDSLQNNCARLGSG